MWGPRVTGPKVVDTLPDGTRKIGLVSDAHGQIGALRHAVDHLQALGAQAFLFNGDALDYWGRCEDAAATLSLLREVTALCIEGNHDAWHEAGAEVRDAELCGWHDEWPYARRIEVDGMSITQYHGHFDDIIHYTYEHRYTRQQFGDMLKSQETEFLIFGHTHTPMCVETDHGLVINPGALAYVNPRDGRPSYALLDLDTGQCTHYEVYPEEQSLQPLRRRGWW